MSRGHSIAGGKQNNLKKNVITRSKSRSRGCGVCRLAASGIGNKIGRPYMFHTSKTLLLADGGSPLSALFYLKIGTLF